MNREFKFRIWNKDEKRWLCQWDEDDPMIEMEGGIRTYERPPTSGWTNRMQMNDNLVLQQYTGLKDINGKEIYEGDILGRERFTDWKVFWQDGSFRIKNVTNYNQDFIITKDGCETRFVKGNIFENPELLK